MIRAGRAARSRPLLALAHRRRRGRRRPPGLTGRRRGSPRAYDAILDADFDRAGRVCSRQTLSRLRRSKRASVLEALGAVVARSRSSPKSRLLDVRFSQRRRRGDRGGRGVDRARAAARRGVVLPGRRLRRPRAVAGAARANGSRAARDGKRIKDALERALALDPALDDAKFGIGLYHYYADIAPAALRLLRWLLLLPGGDRADGLRQIEEARARRPARARRGRLPAAPDLPLVREALARRARARRAACRRGIRTIRSSTSSRPRSTTSTFTMPPRASRRRPGCWRARDAGAVHDAPLARGAGSYQHRRSSSIAWAAPA